VSEQQKRRVVYVISCGTPVAQRLYTLVPALQAAGWDTCVILTPMATRFVDGQRLATLTGYPVRSEYKQPGDPDVLPHADAVLVFPATFNTINKWATGISDTLALGLLCELTGLKVPIFAVPIVRRGGGLDTHPAFIRSIRMLKRYGVRVFYEPDTYPPRNELPDTTILSALDQML
jgi:phosphopantothenoylcysteine synthetase/decarboxylase